MFAVDAKVYEVLCNQSNSNALNENLVINQSQKLLISRLFISHHTVVWFTLVSIS